MMPFKTSLDLELPGVVECHVDACGCVWMRIKGVRRLV